MLNNVLLLNSRSIISKKSDATILENRNFIRAGEDFGKLNSNYSDEFVIRLTIQLKRNWKAKRMPIVEYLYSKNTYKSLNHQFWKKRREAFHISFFQSKIYHSNQHQQNSIEREMVCNCCGFCSNFPHGNEPFDESKKKSLQNGEMKELNVCSV